MMITHFRCIAETLVKNKKMVMFFNKIIILFLFFFFFFLEGPVMVRGENPVVEFSSREELVEIAGYGEEKLSTVIIMGKILCHDACVDHTQKLPPQPISGASVAVFCRNSGKRRKSWAQISTDAYGEFLIDLPSHLHAIPNIEKICHVSVLNLPNNSLCHPAFTGKVKGIKLLSIEDSVRTYSAGKICLKPKPSQACRYRGVKNEEIGYGES